MTYFVTKKGACSPAYLFVILSVKKMIIATCDHLTFRSIDVQNRFYLK